MGRDVLPVVLPKSKRGKQTYRKTMKDLRVKGQENEMNDAEKPVDTLGVAGSSPVPPNKMG
jgi:hypothetical protein